MKCTLHLVTMQIAVHMPLAEMQHDTHDGLCTLSLPCKHSLHLNDLISQEMANSM
jgi:hypothetical protein